MAPHHGYIEVLNFVLFLVVVYRQCFVVVHWEDLIEILFKWIEMHFYSVYCFPNESLTIHVDLVRRPHWTQNGREMGRQKMLTWTQNSFPKGVDEFRWNHEFASNVFYCGTRNQQQSKYNQSNVVISCRQSEIAFDGATKSKSYNVTNERRKSVLIV